MTRLRRKRPCSEAGGRVDERVARTSQPFLGPRLPALAPETQADPVFADHPFVGRALANYRPVPDLPDSLRFGIRVPRRMRLVLARDLSRARPDRATLCSPRRDR